LRRFAHGMEAQPSSQLLEIVEILAHRGFCPQPVRFGLPEGRGHVNLDELCWAGHLSNSFYTPACSVQQTLRSGFTLASDYPGKPLGRDGHAGRHIEPRIGRLRRTMGGGLFRCGHTWKSLQVLGDLNFIPTGQKPVHLRGLSPSDLDNQPTPERKRGSSRRD
jgi:hypothetical protein